MKTVALVVLLVTIVFAAEESADERKERIHKNREECIKESKVDPALIDKADSGEFPDDKKLQCFSKCFYTKAGFLDEKGELLLDVVKAKIPPEHNREKAIEIIELCKDLKGEDACETAYKIHKCYFQRSHELVKKE